jgi:hypothetical protein
MQNVYILKHHDKSQSCVIDEQMARALINSYGVKLEEVVAHVTSLPNGSRQHNKIVISDKKIESYIGGKEDELISSMKHKLFKERK